MIARRLAPALALAAVAAFAPAQDNREQGLGPSVGAFFPTGGPIRNAFGNPIVQFGLSGAQAGRQKERAIVPDFGIIAASRNNNRLFIVPFTATYELRFARLNPLDSELGGEVKLLPFLRLNAGIAYVDYAFNDASGARLGAKRIAPTAGAEIGIQFARRLTLSAEYRYIPKVDGIDFSGIALNLQYQLFRF